MYITYMLITFLPPSMLIWFMLDNYCQVCFSLIHLLLALFQELNVQNEMFALLLLVVKISFVQGLNNFINTNE